MKKIFVSIIIAFFIVIVTLSSYAMQFQTNIKQKDKVYETREFPLFDGLVFVFNDEVFFNGENNTISEQQKEENNYIIAITGAVLVVYWFTLLFIFEKEDEYYDYKKIDDIELLKKYNPMIAGCLVDNRQVLLRDVMAIILNLIQRDYIKMEMVPNLENGRENYIYIISENRHKKGGLDELELYVLSWVFAFYEDDEVDLIKKLKDLSKRKDFLKRLDELNSKAEKKLHKMGANIPKAPKNLRIFNVLLMIFTMLLSVVHIINNGVSIHVYQSTIYLFLFVVACVLLVIPVVALIIHLSLIFIVLLKRFIKSTTEKYTGRKLVQMSALVIVFMSLILLIMYFILPNKYICLDIFMIGVSFLIVKTDNLMTKHNKEVLADYYALKEVKTRIEEYSLIKDEQINYIRLWDEYFIYAVAFGIPIPVVNKLKTHQKEDEDLKYLAKCENLYYVCKAYLEVMWDMEFKKRKKTFTLKELFE